MNASSRPLYRRTRIGLSALVAGSVLAACGNDTRSFEDRLLDAGTDVADAIDVTDSEGADTDPDAGPPDSDAAAESTDATDGSQPPPVEYPVVPASVDTRLSASRTTAGTTIYVDCQARDSEGDLMDLPDDIERRFVVTPSAAFGARPPGSVGNDLTPIVAGEAAVGCSLPTMGLVDASPAPLLVLPGRPALVVTSLPQYVIDAGASVVAGCEVFDAWGNAVTEFSARVRTDPFGDGVAVTGLRATFSRAGLYEVACDVDGAGEIVPATLDVTAGLPATIALGLAPDLPRYPLNQVVRLLPTVQDRFGNFVLDAPLRFAALPSLPDFGAGRFRLAQEGTFDLSALIDPPTATGETLSASRTVIVSSSGPAIECVSPAPAEMRTLAPGSALTFRGEVSDEFGVASVTVNGVPASVFVGGGFEASIPTRFGINFAEIVAQDELGETSRRTCAFLVADQWVPEAALQPGEITLRLNQDAIDDRVRGDGFNSIGDFLVTVLNSRGLRDTLHNALVAANPIYPERCVLDTWLGCVTSVGVTYENLSLSGPHDALLQLQDGGLRAVATVRGIGVRLRITGTFGTSGWVNLSSLGVDLTFNVTLSGGRPSVTLRTLNDVQVGGIDTDFSGITGFVLDLIVDIFEDSIRDLVRDTLRDYIRDSFNDVLDDIFSGLSIDSLGSTIDVPRLDGSGSARIGFGISIDETAFSPARALFGVGARITGDVVRGGPTPGAAIPPGPVRIDPDAGRRVGAGVSIALLNQALHALWRAGFFEASISGLSLGDSFPGEATATLRLDLPPVAFGTPEGRVGVGVGAVSAQVVYPGLFDEPVAVEIGAVASTTVSILGDSDIDFGAVLLDEFFFDTGSVRLDATSAELLDNFLRAVIQRVVDDSVNGALPTLPIPSFALPASLSTFDLPGGSDLRLVSPVLSATTSHFVAGGNFGVR